MLLREPLIRILQPRIFSFFNSGRGMNYLKPAVHSWPRGRSKPTMASVNPPSVFRALLQASSRRIQAWQSQDLSGGFNSGDRDLARSGGTRSVQVTPTKFLYQKFASSPGKRDIR